MPQQEVFFEQVTGDRRIQVLKTYDPAYAREVFDEMDDDASYALEIARYRADIRHCRPARPDLIRTGPASCGTS